MSVFEGFQLAWRGVLANKVRALLTALGVIIGVAAVIALVSVGQGSSAQVEARVQSLGANLLTVIPERGSGTVLTLQNVAGIPQRVQEITAQMPVVQGSVTSRWQDQSWSTTLQGVTQAYPQLHSSKLALGQFFTAQDVSQRSQVAVLGATVAQQLNISGDPVGQSVTLNGQPFTVVGVLQPVGASGQQNQDDIVFVPITAAEPILSTTDLSSVQYQAKSEALAPLAAGHLQAIYDSMFPHAPGQQSVFVISQDQLLTTLNQTTATLTLLLGAVAGVSLLVGGIGIMNIMLVSVAERTREIGIRKAVGARRGHILLQFLLEAAMLSIAGGLIGIVGGIGAAHIVAGFGKWAATVSPLSVLVAFAFALVVGVGFGVWPAIKASGLDPIVALRYD